MDILWLDGGWVNPSSNAQDNTAYKKWARIFNNDATITAAVLDRLVHHCETVIIRGKSYRMKDRPENEA